MPIRTTLIWLTGMLLGLGALFAAAQSILPEDTSRHEAFAASGDEANNGSPEQPEIPPRPAISGQPEAMPFEDSPELNSWYGDAGTSSGPVAPTPEDKSYLINSAKPYIVPNELNEDQSARRPPPDGVIVTPLE